MDRAYGLGIGVEWLIDLIMGGLCPVIFLSPVLFLVESIIVKRDSYMFVKKKKLLLRMFNEEGYYISIDIMFWIQFLNLIFYRKTKWIILIL